MLGPLATPGGLPPLPPLPDAGGGRASAGGGAGPSFEALLSDLGGPPGTAPAQGTPNLLLDGVRDVVGMQRHADGQVESLLTGGNVQPAEVLTSVQKADMAMRLLMQVRNKLVAAYQQIQDMRI